VAPPDKWALQGGIDTSLQQLFLALAGLTLLVGAVGIANTTLVAVLERTAEIGLRRSLGARPVHVTAQVLCESGVLGFLGGLIGSSVAVLAIVVVSNIQGLDSHPRCASCAGRTARRCRNWPAGRAIPRYSGLQDRTLGSVAQLDTIPPLCDIYHRGSTSGKADHVLKHVIGPLYAARGTSTRINYGKGRPFMTLTGPARKWRVAAGENARLGAAVG
jgi:hypothetical protein